MCGILGGNNKNWDYKKGIESLKHRGPDGQNIVEQTDFTLAFARLAIIDLSNNGMQPMFSQDKSVCIVFNGEIYGYTKLRNQLERLGHFFKSQSDTEIVLNAYLQWGEQFINKIDGMFGIAIYDSRIAKVRIYRDRIGIKPLYYLYNGKDFGFASELKGIINMCNDFKFNVDYTAIYDYINNLYIPEPKTMYHNIFKLPPAYRLEYDVRSKQISKLGSYWKLKVNEIQGKQRNEDELIEELKFLIHNSVKEQMVADVPIGTFLSGGVDSSIVSYECNSINPSVETFSIGFSDNKYNELNYAILLSEKLGIVINKQIFKKDEFNKNFFKLREWYDEPFADTSAFPTYLLSCLAKEKITVALTGDGGDEVFGGYGRYFQLKKEWNDIGFNNRIISSIFEKLELVNNYKSTDIYFLEELALMLPTYQYEIGFKDKKIRKYLNIPHDYDKYWNMRKHYNKELPPVTRWQYLDLKTYLPGDILTKVDRTSMAVSLETRVPFLSREVVEFSFSLSEEDRCPGNEPKGLLKKAYIEEIGKNILYRNKKGFSIPARYMKQKQSPQEKILYDLWHIQTKDTIY